MEKIALAFRFDASRHDYIDAVTGECYPHITGMLEATGWIDDTWYTEESSERGVAVHRVTADYDMDALDVASCISPYRGYLLAHVKVMGIMRPKILAVEEPLVHPLFRFGGRPDRDVLVHRLRSVWEIKSGLAARSHGIQTALQAILVGYEAQLPPESIGRFCCYIKDKGKFKLEEHTSRRDFDEANRIIKECARGR